MLHMRWNPCTPVHAFLKLKAAGMSAEYNKINISVVKLELVLVVAVDFC